jgi:hypothetical protein
LRPVEVADCGIVNFEDFNDERFHNLARCDGVDQTSKLREDQFANQPWDLRRPIGIAFAGGFGGAKRALLTARSLFEGFEQRDASGSILFR